VNGLWLFVYGYLIYDTHSRYFVFPLTYIEPLVASAPEDILGLGFYFHWFIFFVIEVFLVYLGVKYSRNKTEKVIVGIFLVVFAVFSVADYIVYSTLYDAIILPGP
jgi:hypothetical protein